MVGNVLHCAIGDVASGVAVTVVVPAPTNDQLCTPTPGNANALFINATNGGAIGSASNAFTVTDPGKIECSPPVLKVVKTPDTTVDVGGLITAGDTATFTITVTNQGPGTATLVVLNDTLPGPLTWSFSSTTQGTCNPIAANALHCDLGNLALGASATVVVTAPTTKELCVATPPNANAQFINAL